MSEVLPSSPEMAALSVDEPIEGGTTMFCTNCGAKNVREANYCHQCGHRIAKSAPPRATDADFAVLQRPEERVGDLLALAFRKREMGDLEGAIRDCAAALQVMPDSTSAHSLLGMLHESQGHREKAIQEFEKVLTLNPGSIADREKLEQLRDTDSHIVPRRITSSRPGGKVTLFESPAGAAAAALAVFLIVLAAGAGLMWSAEQKRALARSTGPATQSGLPLPSTPTTQPTNAQVQTLAGAPDQLKAQQTASLTGAAGSPQPVLPGGPPPPNGDTGEGGDETFLPPATLRPDRSAASRTVPPAAIMIPRGEEPPRLTAVPRSGGNETTVHLPNSPSPGSGEIGPPPTAGSRAGLAPPLRNSGRIEIIVSPESLSQANKGVGGVDPGANMDSRNRKALARQAQLGGNYQRAVREYLKALDGAGEEAGSIHQQIGLCYQRLEERESAIAHYNDAIAEYRRQIAGGKNVEAASRAPRL